MTSVNSRHEKLEQQVRFFVILFLPSKKNSTKLLIIKYNKKKIMLIIIAMTFIFYLYIIKLCTLYITFINTFNRLR